MINIIVMFSIRLANNVVVPRLELLTIDTLAPQVSKGKGKLSFGRWTSHSKYLGRTLKGNYYLRDWQLEMFGPGWYPSDPIGFFLDSADPDDYFLRLGNFLPEQKPTGFGDLVRLDLEGLPEEDYPMPDVLRVRWSGPKSVRQ